LVYISTDYIYKGDRGNYKETDEILPFNIYAWTKLGGECAVKGVKNHLIIRTSFGRSFSYRQAFVDKWTNKDYVERIAPMIYDAAVSPMTGVLNLGTKRKTLYDHAAEKNPEVKGIRLEESHFNTPVDTSMNLQKWIDYKNDEFIAKPHTGCRVCGSDNMSKYLDLGNMPLPNDLKFTAKDAINQERFPLQVMFCHQCGLSQLSVVVNPKRMFEFYTYMSGMSQGYINHCRKMAVELKEQFGLTKDSSMIDIAGNDGTLLKEFKNEIGLNVLNVDPASNLTAIAEANGIPSITDFWCDKVAERLDKVDIITATNVFAHVDNIDGFLRACKKVIKPDGIIVLEFPYLVDLVDNMEWDTIYHEHLTFFALNPLYHLCNFLGLVIIDTSKHDIHGGTVRVCIAMDGCTHSISPTVRTVILRETVIRMFKIDTYKEWSAKVGQMIRNFTENILKLKKDGCKIAGFAASAKGNTLLNASLMTGDIIDYLVDQTPTKIGKYSPGTGIPIVGMDKLVKDPPDYLIILSWNFKEEIMEKCRKTYTGKFIVPIPEFCIIP
jgi:ubiquinone/menaquinone biosynthesis C-methylase UbiE